jgi:hypothetical protein
MKVVINRCFGGFELSKQAYKFLGLTWDGYGLEFDDKRTDPSLIECVETLGHKASGYNADLKVVEIPNGIEWEINDSSTRDRSYQKAFLRHHLEDV